MPRFKIPIAIWIVGVAFIIHQITQKILHIAIPLIDNYFDPFACAVLALFIVEQEQKIIRKKPNYTFKYYELLGVALFIALLSEEIFPIYSSRFTKDIYDYFAFGAGALYFYSVRPKNNIWIDNAN